MSISTNEFSVNGKTYKPAAKPIVIICIDGSADEYLDITMAHDRMPNLKAMTVKGYRGMVRGALPSFTNVNNSSIVTGASPAVHGISGNFFYNAAIDQEVMMNSSEYLRAETLLAAAANGAVELVPSERLVKATFTTSGAEVNRASILLSLAT